MTQNLFLYILIGSFIGKFNAEVDRETETFRHMHLFLEYDRFFNTYLHNEYYLKKYGSSFGSQLNNFLFEIKTMFKIEIPLMEENLKFDDLFLRGIMYDGRKFNLTAFFVILQIKFLAIEHYINFLNCWIVGEKLENYKYLEEPCKIVSRYLYIFGLLHTEQLIMIIQNLLETIECNTLNETFKNMMHVVTFIDPRIEAKYKDVIFRYISENPKKDVIKFLMENKDFFVAHSRSLYSFYENLLNPEETYSNKKIDNKMVKETIALWKYAIELSKTIQESSYTIVKIDIDEFGTEIESFRSFSMNLLRDIEEKKLLISNDRSISKIGITEFFLQMIVNIKGHMTKGIFKSQYFVPTYCNIFYFLRPYSKLIDKYPDILPSNFNFDETANIGFIVEN